MTSEGIIRNPATQVQIASNAGNAATTATETRVVWNDEGEAQGSASKDLF